MTIRTLEGTLPLDINNRPLAKIVQIASRYESNIHWYDDDDARQHLEADDHCRRSG